MTREKFIDSAVREAERKLGVPAGWWGTYRDVRGPGGRRVSARPFPAISTASLPISFSRHFARRRRASAVTSPR